MSEKRRYIRIEVDAPVKCRIVDKYKKKQLSYDIETTINNLSEGGVYLNWPKSWDCRVCTNCLAWVFNHSCILKEENSAEETNKYLTTSLFIKLEMKPPIVPHPMDVITKVVWVKPDLEKNTYGIGLCFEEDKDGKLKKLQEKIRGFRKQKEVC
ncbi:MAG: hypothetical protein ABH836_01835 [Candidatus Omnitrophota bacterium]